MCRHLAYLGPPTTLRTLLIDPPHGLYHQSWEPRQQRYGTVNADGFGVGWYAADDPKPARYRRAVPIWDDESFGDVARVTWSGAILAAVRSATPGTDAGEASIAPFAADGWLFSHNGRIDGWPSATVAVAASLPTSALLDLDARVDSALLWALVLHRLRLGMVAVDALSDTIEALTSAGVSGRFNMLLTDGQQIAATRAGDTLCYRANHGAVVVASEPTDDEPGWQNVPDNTVLSSESIAEGAEDAEGAESDGRISIL